MATLRWVHCPSSRASSTVARNREEWAEPGGLENPQAPGPDTDQCQVAAMFAGTAAGPAEQAKGGAVE